MKFRFVGMQLLVGVVLWAMLFAMIGTSNAKALDVDFPVDRVAVYANSATETRFLIDVADVDLLPSNWNPATPATNKIVVTFPVPGGYFNVTGKLLAHILYLHPNAPGTSPDFWHPNYFYPGSGTDVYALPDVYQGKVTFTTTVPQYGIVMTGFNEVLFLPTKTAPNGVTQIPICKAPETHTYQQCITLFKNAN